MEASRDREILVSLSPFQKLIAEWALLSFTSPLGEVVHTEDIIFKLTSNLSWFFAIYVDWFSHQGCFFSPVFEISHGTVGLHITVPDRHNLFRIFL